MDDQLQKDEEVLFDTEDHNSYIITRKFVEDSKKHSVLTMNSIPVYCPVRYLSSVSLYCMTKEERIGFTMVIIIMHCCTDFL